MVRNGRKRVQSAVTPQTTRTSGRRSLVSRHARSHPCAVLRRAARRRAAWRRPSPGPAGTGRPRGVPRGAEAQNARAGRARDDGAHQAASYSKELQRAVLARQLEHVTLPEIGHKLDTEPVWKQKKLRLNVNNGIKRENGESCLMDDAVSMQCVRTREPGIPPHTPSLSAQHRCISTTKKHLKVSSVKPARLITSWRRRATATRSACAATELVRSLRVHK